MKHKICSVEGCDNPIRARGLCGKHYERLRAHGDVTVDNRSGTKVPRCNCSVAGCSRIAVYKPELLCNVHYLRRYRHGSFESRQPNRGNGVIHKHGYRRIYTPEGYKMEHVLLAEKALGRKLPEGAVVHHMDGNPSNNHQPFNLVICPDQAYHALLHKRAADLGFSLKTIGRQRKKIATTLEDLK